MTSRKTKDYINNSKAFLQELIITLLKNENLTIDELSRALEKNRNYVSAFISACIALDICNIKVTNSKSVSLTKELQEPFERNFENTIPENLRKDLRDIKKDFFNREDIGEYIDVKITNPLANSIEIFLNEKGKKIILAPFSES
ncbi:MAG: hypothetical protein ACTSR3_08240 [Candidatus Helarchaeota archaeon]